jgi:phosphoglycerate dehydrogenase-like enzyme
VALLQWKLREGPIRILEADPARPLEEQVASVAGLIPSLAPVTASVIAAARMLQVIVQFGTGLDSVDLSAAEQRGIPVRNVPGVNAQAVAELALFLMLALARKQPSHRRSLEHGLLGDPVGTELRGKTLGIVGLGATGRGLARIARGIGMDVIAVRLRPGPDADASWVGGPADLDHLLEGSDYVSLHVPASATTTGMIDAGRLARMKRSAYLINVGRGNLVDRVALIEALRTRRIAGAGLDVYWEEPPDPDDVLLRMDNVVATPHLGGVTREAVSRIAGEVVRLLKESLLAESEAGLAVSAIE